VLLAGGKHRKPTALEVSIISSSDSEGRSHGDRPWTLSRWVAFEHAFAQETSMSAAEIESFVNRFTTAWATRRNEDFEAIWHPDGRLVYPFVGRPIKGSEIGLLNDLTKKSAPHLTWRALGWTARDSTVVVEWESSNRYGEHTLTWRGVDRITLRDGKIIEEVVYTDTAPFHAMRRGEALAPLIPFPDSAE
jgi:SnoaL-like protein